MRMGSMIVVVIALPMLAFGAACGCSAQLEDVGSDEAHASALSNNATAAPDATDCSGLAPPNTSASCNACTSQTSCQANGCYNGYWCNTATSKCRSAPTDCGGGGGGGAGGGGSSGGDGSITRIACTGNFGNQLSSRFGRLDGTIVSVVAPGGSRTCNGDSSHVHLQVAMNGKTYDVAINTDALSDATDIGLPGSAWSEGWHTGVSLDYAQLGVHSTSFTSASASATAQKIESFVANANHVSIFATGYNASGVHLVHRNGNKTDGAVIINPTTTPRALLFRFADQSF